MSCATSLQGDLWSKQLSSKFVNIKAMNGAKVKGKRELKHFFLLFSLALKDWFACFHSYFLNSDYGLLFFTLRKGVERSEWGDKPILQTKFKKKRSRTTLMWGDGCLVEQWTSYVFNPISVLLNKSIYDQSCQLKNLKKPGKPGIFL
jgi:hypothetical protein